jgi:hypothetical protein
MTTETWVIILGISGLNLSTLVGGIIHLTNRLTTIETDLKWIKGSCPMCEAKKD